MTTMIEPLCSYARDNAHSKLAQPSTFEAAQSTAWKTATYGGEPDIGLDDFIRLWCPQPDYL